MDKDKIEQAIRLLQITQSCGMLKYFSSKEICNWIINIMNSKEQHMDKDYYYELKYMSDDTISIMKFNADVTTTELAYRLRDFLASCSWSDKVIRKIIKGV